MALFQRFSKSSQNKRLLEKFNRSKQQRPLVLEHLETRSLQAADLCTAFDGNSVASVCKPSEAANISTLPTATNASLAASRSTTTQYSFGQAPANQGTQHRGFMIEPTDFLTESNRIRALDELAGWKVNLVRWQINVLNASDIGSSMLKTVQDIKEVASDFQERGIQIILDFHPTKGGDIYSSLNPNSPVRGNLVNTWREVARQLKDVPAVAGYDVLNEPQGLSVAQWKVLSNDLVNAIRKEARRDQAVVIESFGANVNYLRALPRFSREKNVVYSFHMYSSERYTHQGLPIDPQGIEKRPSGIKFDGDLKKRQEPIEKAMTRDMNTVLKFQNSFGSRDRPRIFVGEFSVVRQSVSALDLNGNGQLDDITNTDGTNEYLRTCIDRFQKEGWDWAYHAYDEAPEWDLRLGDSADLELVKSRLDPTYKKMDSSLVLSTPFVALFNAAAGKALDADGNSLGNGTRIQSWDFHDGLNQRWDFERHNDGTFTIRNRAINKVLDAYASDVGVNGCRVQLWDDLGGRNQRWYIERLANDQLLIRNAVSGKVLDLAAPGVGSNGTALQLWDWNGNVNQKWMLTLPTEINVAGTDGAEAIVVRDSASGWGYEVVVNDKVTQSGPWTSIRSMLLQAGGGNDSLIINSSAYISRGVVMRLEGNAGDDRLFGGDGTDNLIGGEGNDVFYARGGDDRIECGHGDDWVEAGDGADQVWGSLGNDFIDGGPGNDHLFGEEGDDNLFGNWGFDFLSGGTGGDSISGGDDDDEMRGNEGNDTFWGGLGDDLLTELEGQGTDRFYGESGNDRLYGQAEDTLDGGDGFDQVYSNHIPVGQPIILQLESSGKVVDADSNTPGNTGRVQTYDLLSAAANQAWLLESTGDGYYVIRSAASSLSLDANGFESSINGCRVQMYQYLGGRNQQWSVEMQANRTVLIRNRASGKVLDFHAPAAGLNGTGAQLWDDLGGLNQRFRIAVVG